MLFSLASLLACFFSCLGMVKELVSLCPSLVEAHLLMAKATLAAHPHHPDLTLKVHTRSKSFAEHPRINPLLLYACAFGCAGNQIEDRGFLTELIGS